MRAEQRQEGHCAVSALPGLFPGECLGRRGGKTGGRTRKKSGDQIAGSSEYQP